ncbi:sulfatase [Sedimentisphaera salicampi]|uniref:sulfatase n=1 Tax=Sedimentisphaera salicampi TaxID=1941349 RepID=UPI000B9A66C0|nr:sulfatase [Sedimentisphaera salicampi]OXU15738.1 Arylsulfatase [Sedimentisphaera salicampi]
MKKNCDSLSRRSFLKGTGLLVSAVFSGGGCVGGNSLCKKTSRQTNVIIVLADDLGWGDLGCYGSDFIETPNVDKLASEGMKFTENYAPAPVCSPTRAALLTGQYPARVGILDYLRPEDGGLSRDYVTVAEMLKRNDYATGMIGKWHLTGYAYHGAKDEVRAVDHGFDEELVTEIKGVGNGANYYPYVFRDQEISWTSVTEKKLPSEEYLVDRMNFEAVNFIERHKDEPFFLYLSHFAPHTIVNGRKDLVEKYRKKHKPGKSGRENCYICQDAGLEGDPLNHWAVDHNPHLAAMIENVDEGVGKIVQKLDELRLAKDTIVIFTSDNGGESNITTNAHLRKGKSSLYEGGIRVPLVVRWPSFVKADTVSDSFVNIMDFYPTILDAVSINPDPKHKVDGISFLPVLKDPTVPGRDVMYWHYPLDKPHFLGGVSAGAIRKGKWKLIEFFVTGKVELYDLEADEGEQNNLAAKHPEKVKELLDMLAKWRSEVGAEVPKGQISSK